MVYVQAFDSYNIQLTLGSCDRASLMLDKKEPTRCHREWE